MAHQNIGPLLARRFIFCFFRPVPSGLLLLVPSPSVPCVPPVVVPTSVGADVLLAVPGEQLIIIIDIIDYYNPR